MEKGMSAKEITILLVAAVVTTLVLRAVGVPSGPRFIAMLILGAVAGLLVAMAREEDR